MLLAADVRCDWPYPPTPPGPEELIGRETVRAFFEGRMSAFAPYGYTIEHIYDLVDPDTLIAEYLSHTRVLADAHPYENRYLGIVRVTDGTITQWRAYINPVPVLAILDRVPRCCVIRLWPNWPPMPSGLYTVDRIPRKEV